VLHYHPIQAVQLCFDRSEAVAGHVPIVVQWFECRQVPEHEWQTYNKPKEMKLEAVTPKRQHRATYGGHVREILPDGFEDIFVTSRRKFVFALVKR
jgi:hypothetical protein